MKQILLILVMSQILGQLLGCAHNNPLSNVIGLSGDSQKTQVEINKVLATLPVSKANELAQTKIIELQTTDEDASAQWIENYCDFNLFKSGNSAVAKKFLVSISQDEALNEAQDDSIQECLSAIELWSQQKDKNGNLVLAKSEMVLLREKIVANPTGAKKDPKLKVVLKNSAGFVHANIKKPTPELAEALLLLAEVAENLDDPKLSPAETMLLKKVIRDFHHSEFAESAYDQLFERVHFGYTGSSGDKTPTPIQEMLGRHRMLVLKKSLE